MLLMHMHPHACTHVCYETLHIRMQITSRNIFACAHMYNQVSFARHRRSSWLELLSTNWFRAAVYPIDWDHKYHFVTPPVTVFFFFFMLSVNDGKQGSVAALLDFFF